MNDTRIMGAICFAGGDPSGAAVALRRAGFEVTMMPERFRPYLGEPDDYFMEASKAGTHDDKSIRAIMNEIDAIVDRYQGDCWEGGPMLSDHVPFDGLFALAEQEERERRV